MAARKGWMREQEESLKDQEVNKGKESVEAVLDSRRLGGRWEELRR